MRPLFNIPEDSTPKARFIWRNGRRYFSMHPSESAGHAINAEADLLNWTSPAGMSMTIGIVIPCPACEFPLLMKADDQITFVDGDGRLTYKGIIQCPAHWADVNEHGHAHIDHRTGKPKRVRCGWGAVIIDGSAHNPQCPALHNSQCKCGADIDHFEAVNIASGRA